MPTLARPLVRNISVFIFACLVCFALWSARGRAATNIVVNSTSDSAANDGLCTLREAITAANNDTASGAAAGECAAGSGADTISFNVTGAGCDAGGLCTIAPASQLPTITQPVTIDGYTQPGATMNTLAVGNNAALRIELSGQGVPAGTSGLNITAGGTTVRGLAINRFANASGIRLSEAGATGNSVAGNYIGTDAAGTAALANGTGINISSGATNNRVGTNGNGTGDEAVPNLISGTNTAPRASADPATTDEDTPVQITLTGTDDEGNFLTFTITDAPDSGTLSDVSTPDCSASNTCTANVTYTPDLNFNGLDFFSFKVNDGSFDSGEVTVTITVNAVEDTDFVVTNTADTNDGACNADCSLREAITEANADPGAETISFNVTEGDCDAGGLCTIAPTSALPAITQPVTIDGYTQPGATMNTLAVGNNAALRIELSGANAPAGTDGLSITAGGTTVRGLVINRFANASGIRLGGAGATGNSVAGNYIGTDAAGTAALANGTGINISSGATNNRVGTNGDGTEDVAERNLISGNTGTGIIIESAGTSGNIVAGNYIGTDAAGTAAVSNGVGIYIVNGAANNRVGGTAAGEANLIAFNTDGGVQVYIDLFQTAGTGNAVLSNSIHSNGTTAQHLGIDLGADGVTPNDAGDPDTGPNNLQNYPVLSSAAPSGATTTVSGTLDSAADTTYRIEFFSNASCDASGNGEGRTFLGALTGVAPATPFNFDTTAAAGEFITATATNETTNDTSEFSACALANTVPTASASPNPATTDEDTPVQITLTGTDDDDNDLTFAITQQPTSGTLGAISAPDCTPTNSCTATVTYTPNPNFNGPDSFKFKVNDGTVDSAEVTVDINVTAVVDLSINDVTQAEGNTGATTFAFTVTLDTPAPTGGVTFDIATHDGTATDADNDYEPRSVTGASIPAGQTTYTFDVQVNGDTTQETNETFTVNVTNATNTTIADGQGTGTILNDDGAPSAGQIVISEFRQRGPAPTQTSAPHNTDGELDEFIELYNKSDSDFIVVDSSPVTGLATDGWAVVSSDAPTTAKYVIPVGTRIPARGHFLVTNLLGYTLSSYPAGNNGVDAATTATADGSYNADIPDGAGLALFRTGNPLLFATSAERLDAVGFATGAPYFEGTPLAPAGGITAATEHSFLRRLDSGTPLDTQDNASDFVLVSTDPAATGNNAVLGAPGPENLSSPVERNAQLKASLIDPMQPSSAAPNRVRTTCATAPECNPTTAQAGTLSIRRRFTNTTGAPISRLRFRVVNITTLNSPGYAAGGAQADLRVFSSADMTVTVTGGGTVQVEGTTLETPPAQNLGGGLNSTLSAGTVTLQTPLAAGASVNVQFLLGVQQTGTFRFFVNVEALPGPATPTNAAQKGVRTKTGAQPDASRKR